MGNSIPSYLSYPIASLSACWSNHKYQVLIFGLDSVGKTSLLYQLKLGQVITTFPTIGFNVENIRYKGVTIQAWDVGVPCQIRPMWRHYVTEPGVVVFIVDSTDRERLSEAAAELHDLFSYVELEPFKLLVLANKQDQDGCITVLEIAKGLRLENLVHGNEYKVLGTSILTGDGITESLEWIASVIQRQ